MLPLNKYISSIEKWCECGEHLLRVNQLSKRYRKIQQSDRKSRTGDDNTCACQTDLTCGMTEIVRVWFVKVSKPCAQVLRSIEEWKCWYNYDDNIMSVGDKYLLWAIVI